MINQSKPDYIPFGKEWEKEMMKWRKSDLVGYLRKVLIELQETKRRIPSKNPVNNS